MATELYVSAEYNSSTEGWGTTHFSNYSSALNYAKTNAKKAVIVMVKTTTVSGNCIDQNTHKNLTNLDVVIQDGAVMGNANSKWDMTYDMTIQGGGVLQSARGSSSSYGYTHIKGSATLTIGEADSEKKAVVNFVNGVNGISYKTMCISVLYNGYLVANNAEINVGDFGVVGNAKIADCTMLVAGSLGFGAGTNQIGAISTLTNSTVTVKGHDLRGDSTYSAADSNRIANLVMDNSHIIIDDGNADTVAEVVELSTKTTGIFKKPLTLQNNSSITVESGAETKSLGNVTLSDSVINAGNLSIEKGAFVMTGKSAVNVATLTIAEGLTLTMDSSSVLTLEALAGAGMIEINMVEGFTGVKNIINFANDDAAEAMLEKIVVKQDGYSLMIQDGDIYLASPVYVFDDKSKAPAGIPAEDVFDNIAEALEYAGNRGLIIGGRFIDVDQNTVDALASGSVKYTEGTLFFLAENVTSALDDANLTVREFGAAADMANDEVDLSADDAVAGDFGSADNDLNITTDNVTDGNAEIRGTLTGKDVVLDNSKNLAVTGSVTGENIVINNAADAILDGGSDDYVAQFKADEQITFVNDGHAVVDMSAKNIDIENNSTNTITNSTIGFEGDTVTADTVVIDAAENADGVISNSKIGANVSVAIADQNVTGTQFKTPVLDITGEATFGADNTYEYTSLYGTRFNFGSKEDSVNATFDVSDLDGKDSIVAQNGTVTLTGKMDTEMALGAALAVGGTLNSLTVDTETGATTVNIGTADNTDAYYIAHQVMVGGNQTTYEHTLNVYGTLISPRAFFVKVTGNLNVYGDVTAMQLQVAGDVLVSGEDASIVIDGNVATYGIKVGTDEDGKRSALTITDGAYVDAGLLMEVGYNDGSRVGDLVISDGGSLKVATLDIQGTSTVTIDAASFTGGVYRALDLSMSGDAATAVQNAIAINNVAEGVDVLKFADGDIILSTADCSTIYVNSAFSGNIGDDLGDGKYYGLNAFSSLDAALKKGIEYGGAAIEMLDTTVATENLQKIVTKMHGASGMDFSITGNSAGNEFIAIEMRNSGDPEDFTELATLTIKDANLNSYKLAAYQNSKITIEDSTIDFHGDQNGPVYTKGNGEMYIKNSTIKNNTQLSAMGTVMEFDNSTLEGGSAAQISGAMIVKNQSKYILSSAKIYGGTGSLAIEDSSMVRKAARTAADKANTLVYFINGAANNPTAMAAYSYCVFVGGSQYSTTAHTGTGTMTVTNSLFDISKAYADANYADVEGYENSEGLVGVGVGSSLTITNSTFNTDVLMNEGTINVSGESTLNIATKFVGNDIVASGVLKDSNLTMEEFDWETGNVMVDGELEVQNGTFSNVQFRADEGEKVTISGKVVAAGATQFKAVDGEVVLAGEFTSDVSEASSIELEGNDAKLTVEKDGKAKITGGFYLNGGTTTITGNLAEDADLAALTREDAQIDAAYSTWGGTYAADVTLTDTYVWNAMISLNNADTVVTVDNSLLVGWMSFDINAGTLIATNGSLVNHQGAEGWTWSTIGADGALVVEKGSTFNAAKTNLTNNGSITVDGLSSFIANTIIWGENATITIDATDFTGTKKVIDLAGTSSLEGKVTLVNGEGITAIYGEDGDVTITDQVTDTIYVNSAWAGSNVGDTVGAGYIYGFNAASSMSEVAGMIKTDGSDTTIKLESDIDVAGDVVFEYGTGDITFTADSAVTVKQNSNACGFYFMTSQLDSDERTDLYIGENVTFQLSDNVSDFAVWYGPNLTVDGTITGGANWGSLYIFYGEHKVSSTGTVSTGRVQVGFADLTVTGDAESDRKDAHIDTNYLLIEESTFTAENAIIDAGAVHDSNNGGLRYGASEFNIINTDFTAASVTLKHADTVFNVSGGNLNVSGTLSNNSTINVAGESTIRAVISGEGAINLNDATLKDAAISGDFSGSFTFADETENAISGGTVDLTAANVYVGSDASLVIKDDAEVTFGMIQDIYSVITVDDADLTIAGGSLDAGITVTGDGDLSITGELKLGRNVTITLDNGDLDLVNGGTLTGTKGQLAMDHESTITFDDVITAGTLTVDISDYTAGTYRLFDYVGTGSMSAADYEALLGDVMNNDKILVLNNDLFLTDQDMSTLYVNASYDADSAADAGYLYGINAFSSLNDALANVTSDTEEIVVSSDISEALAGSTCSGAIVKGGENDVVITDTDNSTYVNFTNANIGEGVTFDAKYFYLYGNNTFEGNVKASATFYSSGKLTLTGNAEVYTAMSRYYTDSTDGIYVVGTAAAGEGKNAAVQFKATNYLGHYSGTFSVKDTAAEFGYILLNGDTDGEGYSSAKLVLDNAKVSTIGGPNTQPGQVQMNGDAAIIATNDSVLDFRGPNNFGYLSMGENNTLSLTDSELLLGRSGQGTTTLNGSVTLNGASILSNGNIVNGGTISVTNGSTVSVAGTLTNNGTFNVSGESTLNIGKLAGAITVADATILDGSVIGKEADALAGIYIGGTEVNFAGTVTLDTAVNANMDKDGKEGLEATTININKGADVTWNAEKEYNQWQGGFNTDSSDKLNVYGKLTVSGNNVYLKAETLVAEGAEFIIDDAGFQNTYGKLTVEGTMTITDTSANGYQNIKLAGNDNTSTTGELDVDGGTLTINGPSFAFGGGYKSNGWVDVAEATVLVQNGGKITANSTVFRNGVNSTLTLNNGTFEFTTAPDFGTVHSTVGTTIDNNGTIIAENGSTLDFSDRKLENSGTITITDSTFTVEELVNNGTVNVSGESTVVIEKQTGVVNVNDGAVLTDSKLGTVYAYGNSTWQGTNTIGDFSLGWNNYGADIVVNMTGTANVNNFMIYNSEGLTATLNIGSADSDRTTINGNQHNYTTNSVVNVVNADVTGNYASMTGVVNVTNSTYSKFGDFRVVAGGNTTIDPKVKFDNSSICGSYGYIGGWSATASGYGVLELVNNSTWKSSGGSCATANSTITLDNSDMIIGGTFTMYGKLTMDLDSMITFKGLDLGSTGTITIDMSDINTAIGNKLFDRAETGWTVDDYKALISNWNSDMDKFLTVDADGDLIVKENAVVYVNSEYTTDPSKNQYKTFEEAIGSGAGRIITENDTISSNVGYNGVEGIIQDGEFKGTVSGGAVASSSDYKTWDDDTFDTNLTVEGGTFNKIVMGGTRVDKGNSEQIGNSNLTISGGTFNSQIVGGMAYADSSLRGNAILTGDVNLTISGGTFNSWIYGGSISGKGTTSGNTLIDGDITITIDASSKAITFADDAHIVAGSYQNGVVDGSTKVVFTGLSANLGMDADNLVWGGSSADVYINKADGSRVFQTVVTGNRTVSFDAFDGDFTARIRGFNTLEAVNDADVTALAGDLSDIEFWNFDTDSSIAGSFRNNFAGDKFDVDVTGWDNNEATLFSGDVTGFEDMTVTLGGQTAAWDAELSRYASTSYQLTFDAENKVVKFGVLA